MNVSPILSIFVFVFGLHHLLRDILYLALQLFFAKSCCCIWKQHEKNTSKQKFGCSEEPLNHEQMFYKPLMKLFLQFIKGFVNYDLLESSAGFTFVPSHPIFLSLFE